MKTSLFRKLALSIACGCALQTGIAQAAVFIKFEGVDGETLEQVEEALLDIRAQEPRPVGLLLPAIQKVREAAARATHGCAADERTVDSDCFAVVLRDAIQASRRNPDRFGLWNLAVRGLQLNPHRLQAFLDSVGRRRSDTLRESELLMTGLLAGLHEALVDAGLDGPDTSEVVEALIEAWATLTPHPASLPPRGWDVKKNEKP